MQKDATDRRECEEQLAFETLLADLSAKLINLPAGEIDRQIEEAQRLVCEALGLDVSSLWQWRPDNPVMHTLTHYYRPLGGPPVPQTMKGQDYFPWCQRRVLAGEVVVVSSLADFPAEAARDREVFSFYGLKTTLTIPLSVGGGPVFGSVNFNDMRTERRWSEVLVQRLKMVAQIFANALARKVADEALRESEVRMSLAAEAAGVGLWSLNLATSRFWLTDKTRELLRLDPGDELSFERFLSLVHPEDQSSVRDTVRSMVQTRSEGELQYRAVWPDGRVRWMLSRGRVRYGISGEPEFLMGVTVDISDRKQTEAALRESDERLREAAEAAGFGVYRYDLVSGVAFHSPEFLAMYGLPAGASLELDPDKMPKVVHPDDKALFLSALKRSSDPAGSGIFDAEFRIIPGEGQVRWLRARGRTVFDGVGPDRHPVRANGVILDVTARKQADFDSQRTQAELVHLSRVAAMGELAASLAHELNQPLTAIQSNAQAGRRLVASGQPDMQDIQDIFADIVADDQRAAEVIRRVRALLKKGAIDRKPLDLNAVIREAVDLLRTEAIVKGVNIVMGLAQGRLPVHGDRIQIQQVLLNLMANAFDAVRTLPPGKRQVTVRSSRSETHGALVAVQDSGAGIPAASISRLFEPFFTTKPEGLGMGLVICRSILESHGGRIWAENASDRGAVVQFAVPMAGDEERGKGDR